MRLPLFVFLPWQSYGLHRNTKRGFHLSSPRVRPPVAILKQKLKGKTMNTTTLKNIITVALIFAVGVAGALQKPPAKKTAFSESELRTLAQAVPDAKTAGQLYTVAMAVSNNVERQQEYLKAAASCLIACDRKDIYRKYVKNRLEDVAEFEGELEDECKQCSGTGTRERRCSFCKGNGHCPTCKGTGQTVAMATMSLGKRYKPCNKCNESGQCPKCGGEGSTKEKCMICSGTGKAISKIAATRIFHDSCKAIADNMKAVAASNGEMERSTGHPRTISSKLSEVSNGPQDEVSIQKKMVNERSSRRRGRTEGTRSSSVSTAKPVKDGFGTETVDGVVYSYEITGGEAMIGKGGGFSAAVENEPKGVLVVPSKLGGAPVTKIGFAAFYCTKSSEIVLPDSVVTLEDNAFCDTKASRIVLPSSIRRVGNDVLKDSTWFDRQKDGPLYLDNILLGFKNRNEMSTEGAFAVKEGTRVIAKGVFENTDFSEVTLPDSVSFIGEDAFLGCSKLTRITIPKHLVAIGSRAFDGCEALATDLVFPEGTQEIGDCAFRECLKIESVTFPLSIEIIGCDAFEHCPLKITTLPPFSASAYISFELPHTIESVKLIGNWTHIPEKLFSQRRNLKKIVLTDGITKVGDGAFEDCESLEEIQIPDTVLQISNSAFSNCGKLRHVKLPSQLKSISNSLFSRCTSLESVVIPLGVTNIESYAFSDCPSLKSISIPDSVDVIADNAFDKSCHLEKSEKRHTADHLAVVRKAEELFAKNCNVGGDVAQIKYDDVVYAIVENTNGGENFVVISGLDNPSDYVYSFMIFPTLDSRNQWYVSIVKCTEKLRNWIRVSVENKVKHVRKEIPIYTDKGSDKVYAYANGITRGRGQGDLLRKAIREHDALSTAQLVKFVGAVEAKDDTFKNYRISIWMTCGDFFCSRIFSASGTIEEIENEIVKLLTFVNPESIENARKAQSKKEDLFR